MSELLTTLAALRDAGFFGMVVFILWGGYRGWWVFGWIYRDAVARENDWRTLALKWEDVTGRALATAEPPHKGR